MRESFEGLAQRLLGGNVGLEDGVEILERSMIEGALRLSRNNQSAAAKRLGIHRNTLLRKMIAYGIGESRPHRRPAARSGRSRRVVANVA